MTLLAVLLALLPPSPHVQQVVEGWRTSPVYVDQSVRSSVPEAEAVRLARRVNAQNPPVRLAVLPSRVLGGSSPDAFADAVVGEAHADGVYLVVFTAVPGAVGSTSTTAGSTPVGPSDPTAETLAAGRAVGVDTRVDQVLTEELAAHPQPVALLDAVLTRLGVPSSPAADSRRWTSPLLVAVLVAIALPCVLWWRRARRRYAA